MKIIALTAESLFDVTHHLALLSGCLMTASGMLEKDVAEVLLKGDMAGIMITSMLTALKDNDGKIESPFDIIIAITKVAREMEKKNAEV